MIAQLELELQASAQGVYLLPMKGSSKFKLDDSTLGHLGATSQSLMASLKFITLEKYCVKIWQYSQGSAELLKKIQIKQSIKQVIHSDLSGYLLILGDNGKVLILD